MAGTRESTYRTGVTTKQTLTALLAVLFGTGAVLTFAFNEPDPLSIASTAMIVAGASALAGGLIGFLFGIPRAAAGEKPREGADGRSLPYGANTNLEQVSDWLTKIIVGVGLIQLDSIGRAFGRLVASISPVFGGDEASETFSAGLVIYFFIVGFLVGWLLTRVYLGPALSAADQRALDNFLRAEAAERAGDFRGAGALRQQAVQAVLDSSETARRYEELRQQPKSAERINEMLRLMDDAKSAARQQTWTPDKVNEKFRAGTDGDRVYALGLMQGNADLANLASVLDAVERPRSSFEQYQGLAVLEKVSPGIGRSGRERVGRMLREQMDVNGYIKPGSARWAIALRLLESLGKDEEVTD